MIYAKKTGKKEQELIFIQVQTFLGVRIMPTLRYVILWRLKNAEESIRLDKAILQIFKPLKIVLYSS
jgi:hypothetical protein